MGLLQFAVSVHSLVTSAGAYAGLAAIVGLAILVLLHFAQARESAGLREQAEESAQRVEYLEARLAELAGRQPAPAAAQTAAAPAGPATAAASTGARARPTAAPVPAGVAAASFPWAPAGVGAPALTAATTLIPVGKRAGAPAPTATPNDPARLPAEMTEVRSGEPARARVPVGAGAGANGVSATRAAAAPAGPPAARVPQRPPARVSGPGRSGAPARAVNGPTRAGAGAPRFLPPQPEPSKRRTGRVLAALLALVLALAAIAVALVLTKTIGGKSSSTTPRNAAAAGTGSARAVVFNARSVTVAVLNGTATAGLAGRTSKRLATAGYKRGTVATASDQTQPTTTVAYLPGYRADAVHVASILKLPAASVQQVSSSAQAVACPPPAQCAANVVVTVGADLASSPTP